MIFEVGDYARINSVYGTQMAGELVKITVVGIDEHDFYHCDYINKHFKDHLFLEKELDKVINGILMLKRRHKL